MIGNAVILNRQADLKSLFGLVLTLVIFAWLTTMCSAEGLVTNTVPVTVSEKLRKELMLTPDEKFAFDNFKSAVYKNLTMDFLKQDLFLLRFLRAKNLDVDTAQRDMFDFLQFLKENKAATILDEDFSDLNEDFPIHTTIDRQFRPVAYAPIGGDVWNIRRGIIQGKRPRVMRYVYKKVLEVNQKLLEIERKYPNVTQFSIIMNMEGFNPFQHICPMCLSSYINILDSYERFLPGYTHEIIVINAPHSYLGAVDMLKPFLSKNTREALKVFGPNRKQWKPYLQSRMDINKLRGLQLD